MRFDRGIYFAQHEALFGPFGDPTNQRPALDALLGFIENDPNLPLDPSFKHLRWAAYMLATTRHETAHTYRPIEEYGFGAGHDYGVPDPVTGYAYYGRGYVQITWAGNYTSLGNDLGIDLYHNPDLALDPQIAYKILSFGLRNDKFTPNGQGLEFYINDAGSDYFYARRMVNGIDQEDPVKRANQRAIAQSIADAAANFEIALRASLTNAPVVATPAISPEGGTYFLASPSGFAPLARAAATSADAGNQDSQVVSLVCPTEGAIIYYTTDGSTPTTDSPIYTAPFTIANSVIVKAVAVKVGYTDSAVSDAGFAFVAADAAGSISISISPAAALNSGAQWQVDGGEWQGSGASVDGLTPGDHMINFKSIGGWSVPNSQSISVTAGQTAFSSATYSGASSRIIGISGDLAFNSLPVGTSIAKTLTISNNGSDPLAISSISFPTGYSVDWTSGTIASGDSQNIAVTFAPTTSTIYRGTVTINSDKTSGVNTITAAGAGGVPDVVTNSPKASIQSSSGEKHLTFSYQQVVGVNNLIYTVGVSDDLQTWDWTEAQIEQIGSPSPSSDGTTETVTVRLTSPIGALPERKFLRLKVTSP